MIKVTNLDKYFNKGKSNSIHVIDNTSLELSKEGLVTLLGASGSGKTTLLNVLGGLDKAKGTIEFNDIKMNSYESSKWDKIRANNIGYIFQNYYLLENKTIYENIEIVLNMIGIVDEEEVNHRINYVLKAVGMFRFRSKLASDLSGGQKQRVAIARALVKNPEVIIADEPTGNLDSNNSIEILKIIKEISKDRLVVLVTHNTDLAYHYSDRIINIVDGKVVNDEVNSSIGAGNLVYDDRNIYLEDLNSHKVNNLKIYSDTNIEDLEITLVKINNNYYLKTKDNNITIENLNKNKSINLVDAKKEEVKDNYVNETNFKIEELESVKKDRVKKRTFTIKDSMIEAFRKLTNLGRKAKIQIIVLVLLGISFSVGAFMLMSALKIDSSKVYKDKNNYILEKYIYQTEFDSLRGNENYVVSMENRYIRGRIDFGGFSGATIENILPIEAITKNNVDIYPNNSVLSSGNFYDVLIDESLLDKDYSESYTFHALGLLKKEHLIGVNVDIQGETLRIVGTVNTGKKAVYVASEMFASFDSGFRVYNENNIPELADNLTPPENQLGTVEVYVSENMFGNENYLPENYKVIGYYKVTPKSPSSDSRIYFKIEDLYDELFSNGVTAGPISIYSLDGSRPNVENIINEYDIEIKNLNDLKSSTIASSLTQTIITLAVSALIFYFLVRSSLTKRIKEISILRSLGVGKKEVVELFMFEYIIITTFTSLIGVIIGAIISRSVNNSFLSSFINIRVESISFIITVLGIYLVNVTMALIPVFGLLRKTPAQMLTNYDI